MGHIQVRLDIPTGLVQSYSSVKFTITGSGLIVYCPVHIFHYKLMLGYHT